MSLLDNQLVLITFVDRVSIEIVSEVPIMKSRICLLLVVIFCVGLSPAFARSWTDNQGKRISATFKEVYRGNVYLIRGTKTVAVVPFFNLSKADRDFVTGQLEKSGKTDLLPKVGEQRVWTDLQGRAIEAQFIGMKKRNVVVLENDKVVEYVFSTFSVEDQEYVKKQMEERGQGDLVPTIVRPSANTTDGLSLGVGNSGTTTSGIRSGSSVASRAAARSRAMARINASRSSAGLQSTPGFSSGGRTVRPGGSMQTRPTQTAPYSPPDPGYPSQQNYNEPEVPSFTPPTYTPPTYTPPQINVETGGSDSSSSSSYSDSRRMRNIVRLSIFGVFLLAGAAKWLFGR